MIPLTRTQTAKGKTTETTDPGALGYIQGFASVARGLGTGGLGWTPFG